MIKTDKEYTKHMIWYKISSDRTPTKPFVYVWYDIVNDKHYVGSHNGTKGYSYSTGGTAISSELLERPDDFRRVYLRHTETVNEARNLESKAIKEVKANLSLAWYNRQGSSRLKFEQDEIKKKMESSILEFPQLDKNSKFDVVMLNLPPHQKIDGQLNLKILNIFY